MMNHDATPTADRLSDRDVAGDGSGSHGDFRYEVMAHVLESARRVGRVSGEINEFLAAQFEALERALHLQRSEGSARQRSDAEIEEFARQRAHWEREQRAALEKLESGRAQLSEAWDRLEAEQRKLLADRAACERAQARGPGGVPGGPRVAEVAVGSPHSAPSQPAVASAQGGAEPTSNQELERVVRESVLMQFQQLKNDVRSHARRRNSR